MQKLSFKLSFILLTLVILSAHSCGMRDKDSRDGGCHDPEVNNLVVGTWKLQNIFCGTGTSEAATKSVILTIEANNNYSFVTDGVKTSQGTYNFSEKTSQVYGTTKQFLDFSNDGSFILDASNDRLGLGQDVANGKNYSYVK